MEAYQEYLKDMKYKSKHTLSSYTTAIDRFMEYFRLDTIEQLRGITSSNCRDYRDYLKNELGLSESSSNANIRPLKAFFNWLIAEEYLEKSPWKNVKNLPEPKRKPTFLTDAEVDKIIEACTKNNDLIIVVLLLSTGLRRSELINLKISDLSGDHILIRGKGNKERSLKLHPETYGLLKEYLEKRNQKWGFEYDNILISQQGKPYTGEAIRLKIQSICKRAGIQKDRIKDIHPHTFRHTFATNLVATSGIRQAQGALGHSKIATTEIYAHLKNATLDAALVNQKSLLRRNDEVL